jgi:rare lipoprotein A (peptidoglycan hydrolase)
VGHFRLRSVAVLAMTLVTSSVPAAAQDFVSVFSDLPESSIRPMQVESQTRQMRYWKPVASPWRTIVVPVPLETASITTSPSVVTAAPQIAPRALTGYAHELGGIASYYWQEQMTSSGERFDRHGMTAAHKTLPLGTRVRVTNLTNGKSTVVRINDRGPFKPGRVIDLSEAAAMEISMTSAGLVRVAIEVVR